MGFEKVVVIDGSGHLMGRLASVIAKQILTGQRVVVVRCESICISGNFYRNKLKVLDYLRKRMNTKPSKGPYHFRCPSKCLFKVVRGMIPHKTKRGMEALNRLKASWPLISSFLLDHRLLYNIEVHEFWSFYISLSGRWIWNTHFLKLDMNCYINGWLRTRLYFDVENYSIYYT